MDAGTGFATLLASIQSTSKASQQGKSMDNSGLYSHNTFRSEAGFTLLFQLVFCSPQEGPAALLTEELISAINRYLSNTQRWQSTVITKIGTPQ
jgi:hypothetical protein